MIVEGKRVVSSPVLDAPPLQPEAGPSGLGAVGVHWLPAEAWDDSREPWERLARAATPNVFLAPAFALAARTIDPASGLGAFVVARDGAWIGFVPGRFRLRGAIFSLWTHDYAPYGAPLIAPGESVAVLGPLFDAFSERHVAALDWPLLDAGPMSAALAAWTGASSRRMDELDRHERASLAGMPPAPAKDHRRLTRRLAEQGRLESVSTATGYDQDLAAAAFLALEAEGWKGQKGTALAAGGKTRTFFEQAFAGLARRGQARIDMMLLDGRAVAAGVVLTAGDRAWYWKTAYAEAFSRFSPGLLLSRSIGEALMTDGRVALVDSCAIPGHSMIDRIWPGRMEMVSRFIAVRPGSPGWRYHAALALRRATSDGRALAKRLLKR